MIEQAKDNIINPRYKKNENENDVIYTLRLIEILKTERPFDLEWEDIKQLIKFEGNKDSLRKANDTFVGGYAVHKYYQELINKNITGNITDKNIIKEIEDKKIELQKERIKLNTTKVELNKWIREDARLELLFDGIKESIVKIEVPNFKTIEINNGQKEGLLGISDFHFGKLFVSINNKYSEDIFYERMNKLASETVELCKINGISHLHVLNCGDDVEGMTLRISQMASLQYGLTDQVIKIARYMAKFLNKLSEDLEITYHHVLSGNHSEIRAFGDKSFTFENMERIIIIYIHDILENNKRIHIPVYNGKYLSFKIFDYNIYAQHGQKIKNPKRVIADISQQYRRFFDVAYFGHLHHDCQMTTNEASTHDCEVVYIPSIMGSDEFSDDNFFGGAKANVEKEVLR
ncbi:hypothetical protein [Clostridium tagluense]|nr:hypothetical protein [Clostridium tagluense]